MKFIILMTLMSLVTVCSNVVGLPSSSGKIPRMLPTLRIMTLNEYLSLRDDEKAHLMLRDDQTGLLTGNELLSVFYGACGAVRGVIGLLSNPVFSVLGISGTIMNMPTPIPSTIFNPLGIPGFFQNILMNLQDSIGRKKRSLSEEMVVNNFRSAIFEMKERSALFERLLEREDAGGTLTVGNIVDAIDYPCQALDVFHSFINNSTYVGWLQLGEWPLPLRDPLHKLNLLGIPGKIFSSIFGR